MEALLLPLYGSPRCWKPFRSALCAFVNLVLLRIKLRRTVFFQPRNQSVHSKHQQVIRFPFVLDTPYFARVQALSSRPDDNLQEEFVSLSALSRAEVIGILSKCWLNYWTLDSFLGSPAGNLRTTFLPQYSADFRCQGEVSKGPLQRDTWKRSFSHLGIGRWGYQWASLGCGFLIHNLGLGTGVFAP